ncbi:ATPase [Pseudomonas sp. MMS21-TM103]|uniref:BCAM0308 family protein n=1 Tax=unclassified Pseudomonas TaxID=196821 RepID=UPI001EDD4A31|nr:MULTISPECIES: BCAM0308 family protein [unclassified Pseudomonas]MCG4455910.1 ATPase [Pseudomonas sp. MMS21 TM103]
MDKYQQSQKNKLFNPQRHDPTLSPRSAGTALCPRCDALYQAGSWAWQTAQTHLSGDVAEVICPACRRIEDKVPAGTLTLSGEFLKAHHDEILNLIHNTETLEKAEHAMERLLEVTTQDDVVQVTTTGIHLANRIGHALDSAYKGQTQYHYDDDQTHVSIHWQRD